MQFNLDNIRLLVEQAYISHARAQFGEAGVTGVMRLLDAVKSIYQRAPPEVLGATLTVVNGLSATPLNPAISSFGTPARFASVSDVAAFVLAQASQHHVLLELHTDGTFMALASPNPWDMSPITNGALIYRFESDADLIIVGNTTSFVPKVSPILKSNFASPTLSNLEAALDVYANYVRDSKCRLLKDVWVGGVDGPRLVLVNKPEAKMRDSLIQSLELLMRDVSVRPEQNTDETKPVDIRVDWFGSGAIALIEVKWLGRSLAKSREEGGAETYTNYAEGRAQEGADQLADYLDRDARHTCATAPRGYLAVFDARRKGIGGPADRLSRRNALHFENDVIQYDPDHAEIREDFAEPRRFFLAPRASHFLAA